MEEWRPVLGYEGLYEVSDTGQVRSLGRSLVDKNGRKMNFPAKVMRQTPHPRTKYLLVMLTKGKRQVENRQVSNLVCEAFHGPRPAGKFAAHSNGVRHDNMMSNLSWKTAKENEADKIVHGTKPIGEKVGGSTLKPFQVIEIRTLRSKGKSYNEIASELGISFDPVRSVCARNAYSNVVGGT